MGELILCKKEIAAVPYYIEEVSLNVYSLEELGYYISHNVYLCSEDFMSVELCHWVGKELGMHDLESQLLQLVGENVPLHIFIGHLLSASGYLTASEIKKTTEIISGFENKSEAECKKLRADRLLDKNKIVDAIYEYENILDNLSSKDMGRELQGDVWHNLGVAYARLFFFQEAGVCFESAYQLNRKDTSLQAMLCCYRCKQDEEGFAMQVAKYQVPKEMVERICKYVADTSQSEEIQKFCDRMDAMRGDFFEEKAYRLQLGNIIERWKTQYINLCRI